MNTLLDRLAWRMTRWLWAPPSGMPFSEEEYASWIRPEGGPLKHRRWKRPVLGKGFPKTGQRRNLGTFKTMAAAKKHEREIQYFKKRP